MPQNTTPLASNRFDEIDIPFPLAVVALVVIALVLMATAVPAGAQYYQHHNQGTVYAKPPWANSMFEQAQYDFGTVARATTQSHDFVFTNNGTSDLHIESARVSCKCAEPTIVDRVVAPGQTGTIRVALNTLRFVGDRKSTITLRCHCNGQFAEVQLLVTGKVRRDIVINPGKINFQTVASGQGSEQSFNIDYAGSPIWKVREIRSSNSDVRCEFVETRRGQDGLVSYRATVTLSPNHPAGILNSHLTIVTNDNRQSEFPVHVTGNVRAAVQGPSMVNVGRLKVGKTVKRRVMVRSVSEFAIQTATSNDPRVQVEAQTDVSKKIHFLDLTVRGDTEGKINDQIVVETDLSTATIRLAGDVDGQKAEAP